VIDEIFALFERFGSKRYGEDISLERHMLQSAAVAQSQGASDCLVAAALLHDIGYFLDPATQAIVREGRNSEHEALAALWLSQYFGEDVTCPVALHVEAKRYLCAAEPGYFEQLSEASRASLTAQGGPMAATETAGFEKSPYFAAAIALRRADDLAKDPAMVTPPLEHFRALLAVCLRNGMVRFSISTSLSAPISAFIPFTKSKF